MFHMKMYAPFKQRNSRLQLLLIISIYHAITVCINNNLFLKFEVSISIKIRIQNKGDRLHMNLDFISIFFVDYTFATLPPLHERFFLVIKSINTFAVSSDYTTMLTYHKTD